MQYDTTYSMLQCRITTNKLKKLTNIQLQIKKSKISFTKLHIFLEVYFLKCHWLQVALDISCAFEICTENVSTWFVSESKSVKRKFNKNLYATFLLSETKRNREILNRSLWLWVHFHTGIFPHFICLGERTLLTLLILSSLFSFKLHLLESWIFETQRFH